MKRLFFNMQTALLSLLFIICFSCAPKYGAYFPKADYDANNYARSTNNETNAKLNEKLLVSISPAEVESKVQIEEPEIELIESINLPQAKVPQKTSKKKEENELKEAGSLNLVVKEDRNAVMSSREELIMDALRVKLQTMSKKEKRAFRKDVKHFAKTNDIERLSSAYNISAPENANATDTNTLLLVIIAILLPPLAVFLYEGEINKNFWINLLLTILFYIPGLIHALVLIL
jgi:uncharacterized membrane protein YqaE (UPF0057 family)